MFKLVLAAALISVIAAAPNCSIEDNKLLDKCNATMESLEKDWARFDDEESEYDVEFMKNFHEKCVASVECLEPGVCPFITETRQFYNENCLAAKIMSGAAYQCAKKLENMEKPDSLCDHFFTTDKCHMSPKTRCEFIAKRKPCVLQYYEEVCGPEILLQLENDSPFAEVLSCTDLID
ncbi:unnamed protein product [Caenorhabditis bovis]|uniref:T20D4.11-like domain-containing protein n=1 Tax=Caenorhabditis bovis TaxID=2654633 RepID=A0A8S1ETD3_9PELO|nr:unnamed protein product [Caenorhabditis bovis]